MTLLIVFLSVTNLALGYGLAIYLGHAKPFWEAGQLPKLPIPSGKPASGRSVERQAPAPTQPAEKPAAAEVNKSEAPAQQIPLVSVESPASGVEDKSGQATSTTPTEQMPSPSASDPLAEETSLKDTLKDLEAFSEQVQQQDDDPVAPENENSESEASETSTEDEPEEAAEVEESQDLEEEDLLKGIGAFQEQLKKQQELSKILTE